MDLWVAVAVFIGPRPFAEAVLNHINGTKTDNRPENLEWTTRGANCAHAARIGLMQKGSAHHNALLTEDLVMRARALAAAGMRDRDVAVLLDVSRWAIERAIGGRTWKHLPRCREKQEAGNVARRTVAAALPEPLEKEIQRGIIGTLNMLGFWVWSLSQPRATMQSPGLPDLLAVGRGVFALIEVKRKKGRQTQGQMRLQAHIESSGAQGVVYVVLRSSVEAVEWANGLVKGRR